MLFGFRNTKIPYGMFDMERSVDEAKRFTKCETIYHRGQELAWDGKEILPMLIRKHGGVHLSEERREALKRLLAIILWGELAAWKISAQLADRLEPLEAKMAAASQVHDEARHFYVMYDYLRELGYMPKRMDRAPQALLEVVLGTNNLAYKLLGMQLTVETIALSIFQNLREAKVEPVLTELVAYYERDEARHVGLGMQYLPMLIKDWNRRQISAMVTFQMRLMFWATLETKQIENDLIVLGIHPRRALDRTRRKQAAAVQGAFEALGLPITRNTNPVSRLMDAGVELLFPADDARQPRMRMRAAWAALKRAQPETLSAASELGVHHTHAIKTARGVIATGDHLSA